MIAIVDYGLGNLGSIANMFKVVGANSVITSNLSEINAADKLVLTGVGSFDVGMKNLQDYGLLKTLREQVIEQKKIILGLCLGMQLFTQSSEEGQSLGLGWVDAKTAHFNNGINLKIPHMGWNEIITLRTHPLLQGLTSESRFYFAHSYIIKCENPYDILATTKYGVTFPSIIASGNILGTQFHPEKSHKFGMQLLRNFAELS